jgi:hypothetical protein
VGDDQVLRFARFEIQPRERRLLIDGRIANLGSRAFDLLLAFATTPGKLLAKNELLDIVWPNLVVEENNLQVQISTLRKLLGPDVIATIPGHGSGSSRLEGPAIGAFRRLASLRRVLAFRRERWFARRCAPHRTGSRDAKGLTA